jgi:hypothetical protein
MVSVTFLSFLYSPHRGCPIRFTLQVFFPLVGLVDLVLLPEAVQYGALWELAVLAVFASQEGFYPLMGFSVLSIRLPSNMVHT